MEKQSCLHAVLYRQSSFIIDDEADEVSLNTLVNRKSQSTINKNLDSIKQTSASSFYLEVTGTPQANLLQSQQSGWKPYFIYYFKPGDKCIGGNVISDEQNNIIRFTDNEEVQEILADDEFPENGFTKAFFTIAFNDFGSSVLNWRYGMQFSYSFKYMLCRS